jgi:hypothetical protein
MSESSTSMRIERNNFEKQCYGSLQRWKTTKVAKHQQEEKFLKESNVVQGNETLKQKRRGMNDYLKLLKLPSYWNIPLAHKNVKKKGHWKT